MDSKMRVAKTLTKFMVLEGKIGIESLLHEKISLSWWLNPSMRGRELERVFSFFWCWTVGMKEGDSFLSFRFP